MSRTAMPTVNLCSQCERRHAADAVTDPAEPFAPLRPCGAYPDLRLVEARALCNGQEFQRAPSTSKALNQ